MLIGVIAFAAYSLVLLQTGRLCVCEMLPNTVDAGKSPPAKIERFDSAHIDEVLSELEERFPFLRVTGIAGGAAAPGLGLPASYDGRNSLFLFSAAQTTPPSYSLDLSTQENHGAEGRQFYGRFEEIRASLDYGYHGENRHAFDCCHS